MHLRVEHTNKSFVLEDFAAAGDLLSIDCTLVLSGDFTRTLWKEDTENYPDVDAIAHYSDFAAIAMQAQHAIVVNLD